MQATPHIEAEHIARIRASIGTYGFGRWGEAVAPPALRALREEAQSRRDSALPAEQQGPLAYRASITSLGPSALRFLADPRLRSILSQVFQGEFALSEGRSCLTFYNEHDYLGPHLDKPADECVVTILVYLEVWHSPSQNGGTGPALLVYGKRPGGAPRLRIPSTTGGIVLGRGSQIWHERQRLAPGECVVALTGCYHQPSRAETVATVVC